ncbi:endothelin-converting enzyme-like 1 [Amblyomma americanum]
MIKASVNTSVDPCHDFYEFVCGSYSGRAVDQMVSLSDRTNSIFRAMLGATIANRTAAPESSAARKANALYSSCLDVVTKKQSGLPMLTRFLSDHGLDLRTLDRSGSPMEVLFRLYFEYGITAVFAFNLAEFFSKDSKRELLLRIDKNLLAWFKFRAALLKTEVTTKYMAMFLKDYGSQLAAISEKIYITENKAHLAMERVSSTLNSNGSDFYLVQVKHVGDFTPNTITAEEWTRLVLKYAGALYSADDRILVEKRAIAYLQSLYATIGSHGIKTLMGWNVLRTYAGYADSSVATFLYDDYEWECLSRVESIMPVAFHAQQLFAVVPPDTVRAASDVAVNVKEGARKMFSKSAWLDSHTRAVALSKLARIVLHIGYPEDQNTPAALDAYYDDLAYPSGPFLAAWLNTSRHYLRKLLDRNTGLEFAVNSINAFYSIGANQIVVPAAFLQTPVFMERGPASFNYGSLGHVIGHEVMHAYDVRGINVDDQGLAVPWMTPSSLAQYKNAARCVRKEHKSVLGLRSMVLDDELDSENIADFAGARAAYEAFRGMSGEDRFVRAPGPFYPEQLFFIGFCLKWCEHRFFGKRAGRYAPGYARCVVPLRNMRQFSEAFHCKRNARMNPAHKCSFW